MIYCKLIEAVVNKRGILFVCLRFSLGFRSLEMFYVKINIGIFDEIELLPAFEYRCIKKIK